jgi:bifunctional non-homologous end joining protein LigD
MSEALHDYNHKRNFDATPEPSGSARRSKGKKAGHALQFCIQKHDASHLHYDFRLELDGTLKSWAVPKGPSLDPKAKRLAVHVEDHPLDYASFEGHIPEGHYGAGDVIVWDRGVWVPEGDPQQSYAKGRLKFTLQGKKLGGLWNLVRTHMPGRKEQWFLIKHQDEQARPLDDYDVLVAEPDSVLSDRTLVPKERGKGKSAAAKPAAKAKTGTKARAAKAPIEPDAEAPESEPAKPIARPPAAPRRTRGGKLEGARKAPLPTSLKPELATLVDSAPSSGDWRYEIKFDGYRVLARIDGDKVQLFTRNGHDWTAKMPRQAQALAELGLDSGWLDGEMVVANEHGVPDFQALQNAFESARSERIVYYLFDAPYLNGMDLTDVPVEQRRAALKKLLQAHAGETLRFSDDFDESATSLLESACQMQMEGLIGKRVGSAYRSRRSHDWIKLKCKHRQEFVVVGYTEPKGSRSSFGALLLGLHDQDSGDLRYAGKVGTGFSEATLHSILRRLEPLKSRKKAVVNPPTGADARGVHWLEPKLLAEVAYAEMTRDGVVRHSVFHGLRDDKPARDITAETPAAGDAEEAGSAREAVEGDGKPKGKKLRGQSPLPQGGAEASTQGGAEASTQGSAEASAEVSKHGSAGVSTQEPGGRRSGKAKAGQTANGNQVRITHPERVIDASSGTTKQQLAEYYASVAPWLLPQLQDRPVALVRAPEGIAGELFFQKNAGQLAIDELQQYDKAEAGQACMVINSPKALIGAIQMGTVELHTWNATSADFAHPDRFVLDLDPDPALPWKAMVEATQLTLTVLDELGLKSFLKTSGGKGIHIVVPLKPKADWDTVKDFSHAIVSHIAKLVPERFSAVSGPKNRVGKIFIDYLRNGLGATTACAYAARAREGLPVSVPIERDEVAQLKGGNEWNIHNLQERLAQLKDDPWADFDKQRQSITAAMRKRLGLKA